MPWLRVAVAGLPGLLLALRRVPVVARALTAPGMVNRLKLPHSFWVAGGWPSCSLHATVRHLSSQTPLRATGIHATQQHLASIHRSYRGNSGRVNVKGAL